MSEEERTPGQRFNPYRLFTGAYIPRAILEYRELSANAKLLWAKMAELSMGHDSVTATHKQLADGIGLSPRSIPKTIDNLIEEKFIEKVLPSGTDRLDHIAVTYFFRWHPIMESALRPTTQSVIRPRTKCNIGDSDQENEEGGTPPTSPNEEPEPEPEPKPEPDRVPYADIVHAYNESIRNIPTLNPIQSLTTARRDSLRTRFKEPLFRDKYRTAFGKVRDSSFLNGQRPGEGHANFKADLDWLIKNDENYVKVLEGKYDDQEQQQQPFAPPKERQPAYYSKYPAWFLARFKPSNESSAISIFKNVMWEEGKRDEWEEWNAKHGSNAP